MGVGAFVGGVDGEEVGSFVGLTEGLRVGALVGFDVGTAEVGEEVETFI